MFLWIGDLHLPRTHFPQLSNESFELDAILSDAKILWPYDLEIFRVAQARLS